MRNEIHDDDIIASRPYNRRVEADDDTSMMVSSPTTTTTKMGDTSSSNKQFVDETTIQDEVDENVTREQMKMAAKQRVKQNLEAKRIIEKAKEEVDEDSMRRRTRGTSGMSNISSTSSSTTFSKKRVQTAASSSGLGLRPHAV